MLITKTRKLQTKKSFITLAPEPHPQNFIFFVTYEQAK